MPERASVNQRTHFGTEVTSGTPVSANKRFKSFAVMVTPDETTRAYGMQGAQNDNTVQLVEESVSAAIDGWPDYVSDVYLWSSLLGTATITSIGQSSNKWVFSPNADDVDVPTTFTVEHGSSVRAGKFTYGVVTDMGDDWTRKDVKLIGCKMIGQMYQDNITLTSNPTKVASVAVAPLDRQFYLDSTSAGLGTTRLTRVFAYARSIGGKYGPNYPSDRSHTDWSYVVNLKPKFDIKLTLMADSNGMVLLANLRAQNPTYWLRCVDQGTIMPGENTQVLTMSGSPTGGTFTLTYKSQTTAGIAYNAAASAVQSALQLLSGVGTNMTVSGSNGGPWTVVLAGALSQDSTDLITANNSGLTGGSSPQVGIVQTIENYLYQHDVAVQVSAIGELRDDSGAYAYEVTLSPVYDPTWGHTHILTIQNQLSGL